MPEITFNKEAKTKFDPAKDDFIEATEFRRHFSDAVDHIHRGEGPFCITSHGKAKVAMVAYDTEKDNSEHEFVKFISVSEARASLTGLMALAATGNDRVVLTNHGSPQATIVSLEEYQARLG